MVVLIEGGRVVVLVTVSYSVTDLVYEKHALGVVVTTVIGGPLIVVDSIFVTWTVTKVVCHTVTESVGQTLEDELEGGGDTDEDGEDRLEEDWDDDDEVLEDPELLEDSVQGVVIVELEVVWDCVDSDSVQGVVIVELEVVWDCVDSDSVQGVVIVELEVVWECVDVEEEDVTWDEDGEVTEPEDDSHGVEELIEVTNEELGVPEDDDDVSRDLEGLLLDDKTELEVSDDSHEVVDEVWWW
jgi:hypothetical protein